jgi:hypothetical protein
MASSMILALRDGVETPLRHEAAQHAVIRVALQFPGQRFRVDRANGGRFGGFGLARPGLGRRGCGASGTVKTEIELRVAHRATLWAVLSDVEKLVIGSMPQA